MTTPKRPPVIVEINSESRHQGGSNIDLIEVDRDEWEALTPLGRAELCNEIAEDAVVNYFGYGWNIPDEADMKMTEENTNV